jgi:hypothetical protein
MDRSALKTPGWGIIAGFLRMRKESFIALGKTVFASIPVAV